LAARSVRDAEVAGSNPAVPTSRTPGHGRSSERPLVLVGVPHRASIARAEAIRASAEDVRSSGLCPNHTQHSSLRTRYTAFDRQRSGSTRLIGIEPKMPSWPWQRLSLGQRHSTVSSRIAVTSTRDLGVRATTARRSSACDSSATTFTTDRRCLIFVKLTSVVGNSEHGFRAGWVWAPLADLASHLDPRFTSGRGLYESHLDSHAVLHTLLDANRWFSSLSPPIPPLPPDPTGAIRPEFVLPDQWPPVRGDRSL